MEWMREREESREWLRLIVAAWREATFEWRMYREWRPAEAAAVEEGREEAPGGLPQQRYPMAELQTATKKAERGKELISTVSPVHLTRPPHIANDLTSRPLA